jgi:hypothetical protein
MGLFEGWTPEAIALVERAMTAHGGRDAWLGAAAVRLPFQRGSGSLLTLKGFGRTFPPPREFEVRPHERTTIFHDYPEADRRGIYHDGDVRIEDVSGRTAAIESLRHGRTFAGTARWRRWSPLDALYFFGYALVHYHRVPFTLGDARLVRILRRDSEAEGVDVVFPEDVETHCRRQQFYFGADGRIVRHDYIAEVVGAWASGAHFWERYSQSRGLLIARRRRVVWRIGRRPVPLSVLCVDLGEPSTSAGTTDS